MRLTWRDGAATIMTAGAVGLYLGFLAGASIPYLSGPEVYGGAVLAMGLAARVLGGGGVQGGARALAHRPSRRTWGCRARRRSDCSYHRQRGGIGVARGYDGCTLAGHHGAARVRSGPPTSH